MSRRGARSPAAAPHTPVDPTTYALRVKFDVADYNAGSIVGTGSTAATLSVATNGPTYNASVAAFNNKPTLAHDGVNDQMASNVLVLPPAPSTMSFVCRVPAGSLGVKYLMGQYTDVGYFFSLYTDTTDTLTSDHAGISIPAADMANVHVLTYVLYAGNTVKVYRDRYLVGTGTVTLHTGTTPASGGFRVGSAGGGGFSAIEWGEICTWDQALGASQVAALYDDYFSSKYGL